MKTDDKRLLSGILLTAPVVFLIVVAFYWQPIVALAHTTIDHLQDLLFLPLVLQNNGVPLPTPIAGDYVVIGWNDLGMHCYNRDFADLAVPRRTTLSGRRSS